MSIIIFILLIHFLADFGLQTHEQAIKKSYDNYALMLHVSVYSGVWLLASSIFLPFDKALAFASLTFMAHFITDYCTSRLSKPFFEKQDYHNGFVVVGADQLLHYLQLFLTLKLLT